MEQWVNERVEVVKRQNQILRKMNQNLRSALKAALEYNDNLFLELCKESENKGSVDGLENKLY